MPVVLKSTKRTKAGSREACKLRKMGQIPGIVYGHKLDPLAVVVDRHDLEIAIQHGERVLTLDVEGQNESVLIKEIQRDTFATHILHVDFARVDLNEKVTVTVELTFKGTPVGLSEGGALNQVANEIEIECVVTNIPEQIKVVIDDIKLGETLHMKDIALPEGATLISDPDAPVLGVNLVAEEAEVEEGAEVSAEPEVIGAKEEESSEG